MDFDQENNNFPDDNIFETVTKENKTDPDRSRKIKKSKEPVPPVRTDEDWRALFPRAPTAPDGYMVSFTPDQTEEYLEALDFYGFVVIKVLEDGQCDKTVTDMISDINRQAKNKITKEDPMSWETHNWPSKGKFLLTKCAFTQAAYENRTNENIYKVFCNIFGDTRIWCNIDKWGVMRGSKNLPWKDDQGNITLVDKPEWRYHLKAHWDLNPWIYVQRLASGEPHRYQGLVALDDCPEEVGGFCSVPGSTRFLQLYTKEYKIPYGKDLSYRIPETHPMVNYMQRVPLRKGEMVIWDSGQLHANFENTSNRLRLIQFIRCLPATKLSQDHDRFAPRKIMKQYKDINIFEGVSLSPLGRKMCALDEWE